jgi:two-component system, OmpR family, KDP operon response regulator KdpE
MKILIVDDEPQIRTLLRVTLARAGYEVVEADSARAALSAKAIDKPDLVLLDLGLPDRDGLELVAALKAEPAARLIVLSAREETEQKVAALDLGADDYVTKPFDTDELLARVRAALRQRAEGPELLRIETGDIAIDLDRRIVTRGGDEVHLTPKEYAVLASLAGHPGRVITHGQLLRTAWGPAQEGQTEYLRVVMRALRQKLERDPSSPDLLINEPGVGYRLRAGRD